MQTHHQEFICRPDATSVYWNDRAAGTITKIPIAGGTPQTLASGQNSPFDIAVDETYVYWSNTGTRFQNDGAVMKIVKSP